MIDRQVSSAIVIPMSSTITIRVNGAASTINQGWGLLDYLRAQGLPPQSVVVELNGQALSPSEFQGVSLKSNDVLEIVKIVAGG